METRQFNIDMPLKFEGKADEVTGEWKFTGVASTTSMDRDTEKIDPQVYAMWKAQFENFQGIAGAAAPVCIGAGHKAALVDITSEVGAIDSVVAEYDEFTINGHLFKSHPDSRYIYERLNDMQSPPYWKLSVGGFVSPEDKVMEWDENVGGFIAVVKAMQLDHVLLCRGDAARNQGTSFAAGKAWFDPVFKAAEEFETADSQDDLGVAPEGFTFSDKAWGEVDKEILPASSFLFVGDLKKKETWRYPIFESPNVVNKAALEIATNLLEKSSEDIKKVVTPKILDITNKMNKESSEPSTEGKCLEEDNMTAKELVQKLYDVLSGETSVEEGTSEGVEKAMENTEAEAVVENAEGAELVEKADEIATAPEFVSKSDFDSLLATVNSMKEAFEAMTAKAEELVEEVEKPADITEVVKAAVDGLGASLIESINSRVAPVEKSLSDMTAIVKEVLDGAGVSTQVEAVGKAGDEDVFDGSWIYNQLVTTEEGKKLVGG